MLIPLPDRAILTVEGPDRSAFLQGLVSNDVDKVGTDHAVWAALLTPQGRYLFDFFIAARGDALLLEAESARLGDLRKRLSPYRLRSKVTLTEAADAFAVFAVIGAGAAARLGLPDAPGAAVRFGDGVAFVDPRLVAMGVRIIVPADGRGAVEALGLPSGTHADYEALRLVHGIPDGSRDLTVDKALLLENGFDELNGVAWDKGCYMGQELTARTKYRGLVKKRLLPVTLSGAAAPGTPVMLDGKEAGELRSIAGDRGLALLRLDAVAQAGPGKQLTAGDAVLDVRRPDWLRLPEAAPAP